MNVLVLSAGRRNSLVRAFRAAVHTRRGIVVAADLSPLAPAIYVADKAVPLPRIDAPDYIEHVLDIVRRESIQVLIPILDAELPLVAARAADFRALGCTPIISTPNFVDVCSDKWLTFEFCNSRGFATHRSWLPGGYADGELPEKLYVKPRRGSASQDNYKAAPDELPSILPRVKDPIIQEKAEGVEVTIDAFIDFDGRPIHYVPRSRIRHLAGESIVGQTLDDDVLGPWLVRVLDEIGKVGARGPMTLQCFMSDRGPLLTEINPRFGGGFPLALEAGGNYPEWCLQLAEGTAIEPKLGEYGRGLYMSRYYVEHFFTEPAW